MIPGITHAETWRVGYDAVFDNLSSPPGKMDSRETGSTVCVIGYLHPMARSALEARAKVVNFLKRSYEEPLLRFDAWNTCKEDHVTVPKLEPIQGLTLKVSTLEL